VIITERIILIAEAEPMRGPRQRYCMFMRSRKSSAVSGPAINSGVRCNRGRIGAMIAIST